MTIFTKLVGVFPSGFGASGEIYVKRGEFITCAVCGHPNRLLLCIDSSGGEYGDGSICGACITQAFSDALKEETND